MLRKTSRSELSSGGRSGPRSIRTMRRMRRSETLLEAFDSRVLAIEALASTAGKSGGEGSLEEAQAQVGRAAELLGDNRAGSSYARFARLLSALSHLTRWAAAVRTAELEA